MKENEEHKARKADRWTRKKVGVPGGFGRGRVQGEGQAKSGSCWLSAAAASVLLLLLFLLLENALLKGRWFDRGGGFASCPRRFLEGVPPPNRGAGDAGDKTIPLHHLSCRTIDDPGIHSLPPPHSRLLPPAISLPSPPPFECPSLPGVSPRGGSSSSVLRGVPPWECIGGTPADRPARRRANGLVSPRRVAREMATIDRGNAKRLGKKGSCRMQVGKAIKP